MASKEEPVRMTAEEWQQQHHAPVNQGMQMESVDDFCARAGISRRLFDLRKAQGTGPIVTRIGRRVLIAREDGNAWLAAQRQVPEGKRVA
jgi:hypothetical protein